MFCSFCFLFKRKPGFWPKARGAARAAARGHPPRGARPAPQRRRLTAAARAARGPQGARRGGGTRELRPVKLTLWGASPGWAKPQNASVLPGEAPKTTLHALPDVLKEPGAGRRTGRGRTSERRLERRYVWPLRSALYTDCETEVETFGRLRGFRVDAFGGAAWCTWRGTPSRSGPCSTGRASMRTCRAGVPRSQGAQLPRGLTRLPDGVRSMPSSSWISVRTPWTKTRSTRFRTSLACS